MTDNPIETKTDRNDTCQFFFVTLQSENQRPKAVYNLQEDMQLIAGTFIPKDWNGDIICMETNAALTLRTNITQGYLKAYSFTIVLEGRLQLQYNGQELTLQKGDLLTYMPGLPISVPAASARMRASTSS